MAKNHCLLKLSGPERDYIRSSAESLMLADGELSIDQAMIVAAEDQIEKLQQDEAAILDEAKRIYAESIAAKNGKKADDKSSDYVKTQATENELKGGDNGNNSGTKGDASGSVGEKTDESGISTEQSGSSEQVGNQDGKGQLSGGPESTVTADSGQGQGNEVPADERLGEHAADDGNQQSIERGDGENGSLPRDIGADNYDLRDKPNIALTPAKRRDINNLAEAILKKPVNEITEADKNVLRQYTGSGGLSLQDSVDKGDGIFNQHYTDYTTVKEIYRVLVDAGVKMKKMLEPSGGSGNFVGMFPRADWSVVDIDKTNTQIVERLYPDAEVFNESYETYRGKNFDVIISNVPFASVSALPRERMATVKPAFKAIHNFFFAQSVDKLKTGGVMAFMTSTL
ncbi:hypothetical protein CCP3SC15_4240001 [Gammaproteobacteria bacterium]